MAGCKGPLGFLQRLESFEGSDDAIVNTATMYLTGSAKRWWRTLFRRVSVSYWDDLKRELKAQFLQQNGALATAVG